MLALNSIHNRLHRQYYLYALIGFFALSAGYLLRAQIDQTQPVVILLLGVFPNLFGSFATPFLLGFLLERRYPALRALDHFRVFGLINLFTFAACLLIEYLHIVFEVGVWDSNDIIASVVGGLASLLLFFSTRMMMKTA